VWAFHSRQWSRSSSSRCTLLSGVATPPVLQGLPSARVWGYVCGCVCICVCVCVCTSVPLPRACACMSSDELSAFLRCASVSLFCHLRSLVTRSVLPLQCVDFDTCADLRCESCYIPFHEPPDIPQCVAPPTYLPPPPPGPFFYPVYSPP
jgi:hypothetical protein